MAMMKYIVPALAVAGSAMAASSSEASSASTTSVQSCSASATLTVASNADLAAVTTCKTYTGSIAIATGTTESISISNLEKLEGSLVANNVSQMTQLSADSLTTISKSFILNDVQILSAVNFPALVEVESMEFQGLPNLNTLNFDAGVKKASNVDIQNTFLSSLSGISLEEADTFYLANNGMLKEVDVALGNISTSLTLVSNGDDLAASFPDLTWAYNLTFRDVGSLSLPLLAAVNGSLGFYENTFDSISCPNLTTVGGTFSIDNNADLTNTSFPKLSTVEGGFQIANNTKLDSISGFPELSTIGGAFDCSGSFGNVTLPSLSDVRGAFSLESDEDISSICTAYKAEAGSNKVIKGKFSCVSKQSSSSGGTTVTAAGTATATGTSSSASSTSTEKGAAGHTTFSTAALGMTGILAAMFGLM